MKITKMSKYLIPKYFIIICLNFRSLFILKYETKNSRKHKLGIPRIIFEMPLILQMFTIQQAAQIADKKIFPKNANLLLKILTVINYKAFLHSCVIKNFKHRKMPNLTYNFLNLHQNEDCDIFIYFYHKHKNYYALLDSFMTDALIRVEQANQVLQVIIIRYQFYLNCFYDKKTSRGIFFNFIYV